MFGILGILKTVFIIMGFLVCLFMIYKIDKINRTMNSCIKNEELKQENIMWNEDDEDVIYSGNWGRKTGIEYVIINNEKIFVGDKVWREEIGDMEVFIIEKDIFGDEINLILKLEDNTIPSAVGQNYIHPLKTQWFQNYTPGRYHLITIPYNNKTIENFTLKGFHKITVKNSNTEEIKKQFTKSDLKNGDIVELRNGERYVYIEGYTPYFKVIISLEDGYFKQLALYDNDLRYNDREDCKYDIIKILDMSEIYKNPKGIWELETKGGIKWMDNI